MNIFESSSKSNIALTDGVTELTYQQLQDRIEDLTDWINRQSSLVIGLHAQNSIDWVLLDLACQNANVIFLPLPDFFSHSQIEHCIYESHVDILFTNTRSLVDHLNKQCANTSSIESPLSINAVSLSLKSATKQTSYQEHPIDTQKITFTSGSTGSPKGVCLSKENQWLTASSISDAIDIVSPRHLCLLPLSTLLENIAGVYAPILSNGTIIVASDEARGLSGSSGLNVKSLLSCIEKNKPNSIIILPQILSVLIQACEHGWVPPESLKFIAVGGAKVSPEALMQAHQFNLPVYEGYGLSECGSVIALNTPNSHKIGCVGQILPHVNVSIIENEIVVKGTIFLGYLSDQSSWYPTHVISGDLGDFDDSYLLVKGRKKNIIINSFGRNISPEWIESEITSKSLISKCVVFGESQPSLIALLSAPEIIENTEIDIWILSVNSHLPDYAQIKSWHRLEDNQWDGLLTANGRPQRENIYKKLEHLIDALYQKNKTVIDQSNRAELNHSQVEATLV